MGDYRDKIIIFAIRKTYRYMLIGREKEQQRLLQLATKEDSQFCAVYGRRRVGKTYLIRESFNYTFDFYYTGVANVSKSVQLAEFRDSLQAAWKRKVNKPKNWFEAFKVLGEYLSDLNVNRKKFIFIDELSWLDTPRSNFVSALEHFWNGWATARAEKDIVLIVCASSASWITKKIFKNKGGLHNRVTEKIYLSPFSLSECRLFSEAAGLNMTLKDIAETYMILGGVPYYWSLLKRGRSASQNIDDLFFSEDAVLANEFKELYTSLYKNPKPYMNIVKTLGKKKVGMTRSEIAKSLKITSSGTLTEHLEDLQQSGFIRMYKSIQKKERDSIYQLIDQFTLFYFQYMENSSGTVWVQEAMTPKYKSWSGLAFERLCLWHIPQIKKALGISGISCNVGSWIYIPTSDEKESGSNGTQIDLLIDRSDNVITICEMKFYDTDYNITSKDEEALRKKRAIFMERTQTKKAVHIAIVTTFGISGTKHINTVQQVITLKDLAK